MFVSTAWKISTNFVIDCCDQYYLTEEMYDAIDQYGYDTRICESCRDDYYLCEECSRYVHENDAINAIDANGDKVTICSDCRNRLYQACDKCESIVHKDIIEGGLCPACHSHQENHSEVIA